MLDVLALEHKWCSNLRDVGIAHVIADRYTQNAYCLVTIQFGGSDGRTPGDRVSQARASRCSKIASSLVLLQPLLSPPAATVPAPPPPSPAAVMQ